MWSLSLFKYVGIKFIRRSKRFLYRFSSSNFDWKFGGVKFVTFVAELCLTYVRQVRHFVASFYFTTTSVAYHDSLAPSPNCRESFSSQTLPLVDMWWLICPPQKYGLPHFWCHPNSQYRQVN